MNARGISDKQAQALPGRSFSLAGPLLRGVPVEILRLLEWESAERIDLNIRPSIIPGNPLPYWWGNEGYVFGLDVAVDGKPQPAKSAGRLLLKVFHEGINGNSCDGALRGRRASFLCAPGKNLHLQLMKHHEADRPLFAGAPILSFQHNLGLDGDPFVCYVMNNANEQPGRSVLQWRELRQERLLTARERIWLAHDLARCVAILEELGLEHCDISPQNVLVLTGDAAGNRPAVSLVDFDLFYSAADACPLLPVHKAPPEGGCPGHEGYLPPLGLSLHDIERQGSAPSAARYDRFSLGLLIIEFLTWCDKDLDEEQLPYLIPQSVLDRLGAGPAVKPPLGCLWPMLGPSIQGLVKRLLSRSFEQWPSPQEWISALERPDVYGLCVNPVRSFLKTDRRRSICAFPATEAFGEWLDGCPAGDRARRTEQSRMRAVPGGWTFAEQAPRRKSAGGLIDRCADRFSRFWHCGAVCPMPHFRWMTDERGAELMRHRIKDLSHCPVCGAPLSITNLLRP